MARPREKNRIAVGKKIAVLFCLAPGGLTFGVMIDKEDLPRVVAAGKWQVKRSGDRKLYCHKSLNRTKVFLHRFLVNPKGEMDHINGSGLDNRKANLRVVTRSQNMANRRSFGKFKGVTTTLYNKYAAVIGCKGKRFHIGVFSTPERAAKAYDKKAIELFGPYARLNFPRNGAAYAAGAHA